MTVSATSVAAAVAIAFSASTANAEGLSLGIGASTTAAPGGDATATTPPPSTDAAPAPAAAPAADAPPEASPATSQPLDENPANYEFAFVSVGAYQSWAIAGDVLYFGAGGGLGPPLFRYGKLGTKSAGWDPTLEIAYANAFLRLSPPMSGGHHYVDLDVGPKIALGSAMYDAKEPGPDGHDRSPTTAFSFGGYADLRFGSDRIKVGPRFEYDRIAYPTFYENGWRVTPLMLRVVH